MKQLISDEWSPSTLNLLLTSSYTVHDSFYSKAYDDSKPIQPKKPITTTINNNNIPQATKLDSFLPEAPNNDKDKYITSPVPPQIVNQQQKPQQPVNKWRQKPPVAPPAHEKDDIFAMSAAEKRSSQKVRKRNSVNDSTDTVKGAADGGKSASNRSRVTSRNKSPLSNFQDLFDEDEMDQLLGKKTPISKSDNIGVVGGAGKASPGPIGKRASPFQSTRNHAGSRRNSIENKRKSPAAGKPRVGAVQASSGPLGPTDGSISTNNNNSNIRKPLGPRNDSFFADLFGADKKPIQKQIEKPGMGGKPLPGIGGTRNKSGSQNKPNNNR